MGRVRYGGGAGKAGCLVTGIRLVALAVIGPGVAIRRWWWARRRGDDVRSTLREAPPGHHGVLRRLDWTLDVPSKGERAARRRVATAIVRIAGRVGRSGDIYHLVYRPPGASDAELRAVGPLLQALGDRVHTHLAREALEGRTSLWPALPRGVWLAEHVDAGEADPDAPGEPDGLVGRLPCRWAFAMAWRRERAATVFRVAVWVPTEAFDAVRSCLDRS